jgi:hypothetical protein
MSFTMLLPVVVGALLARAGVAALFLVLWLTGRKGGDDE